MGVPFDGEAAMSPWAQPILSHDQNQLPIAPIFALLEAVRLADADETGPAGRGTACPEGGTAVSNTR